MRRVETLVVGAGQAGLAVSRCLTEHAAEHVVVEQDRVAERWRSARWDSLRLLTPNWMSRLPAWSYAGTDPDGYMAGPELVRYLEHYAGSFAAPVHENTTVERVEAHADGLRVVTSQRTWLARNVVVATGTENRAYVPPVAGGIDPRIRQLTAGRYRGPAPDSRRRRAGGRRLGVRSPDRRRAAPVRATGHHLGGPAFPGTAPLPGPRHSLVDGPRRDPRPDHRSDARRTVGPPGAVASAVRPQRLPGLPGGARGGRGDAGRLVAADGRQLSFADDLPATIGGAQARMERLLRTIDGYIAHNGRDECTGPAEPSPPPVAAVGPAGLDLGRAGIATVIWATGYRPAYPWLRVPVLDRYGEIAHRRGVTDVPGLYVLGLRFLYRRNSTFVDGVGHDARFVAGHVMRRMTALAAALPDSRDLSA